MSTSTRQCVLMILDGWGLNPETQGNAVAMARTPNLDGLASRYPHTRLKCFGKSVGLPAGVMGNSEVGHLNIGAGRIVYQDLLRIDRAIENGEFFSNPAIAAVMDEVRARGRALHLVGLVSDGGVHSQLTHLTALVDMAKARGLQQVFIHAVLDGRDTPPDAGAGYLKDLSEHLDRADCGTIATICGRYYAMDRDNRWERTRLAYRLYTAAEGRRARDPLSAAHEAYEAGETDEFVRPIVITDADGKPTATVADGDAIICFNFRADRVRQITRAFTQAAFDGFTRTLQPDLCGYICMTLYDETFDLPVAFPPVHLEEILGEVISRRGLRQLRIAETEKYAHVTYFFNGGVEKPFALEERCLISSPQDVPTYDFKPEMSAFAVTDELIQRLRSNGYSLVVLNFANMDMVGHTGVLEAAIKACETVDACVGRIVDEVLGRGGALLVTADHGNSEQMRTVDGKVFTAHTTNPVPLILVDDQRRKARLRQGILGDIAPTILEIMAIPQPEQMTGRSLLQP